MFISCLKNKIQLFDNNLRKYETIYKIQLLYKINPIFSMLNLLLYYMILLLAYRFVR